MTSEDFMRYAQAVSMVITPVLAAGAWISNCVLGKRNQRLGEVNRKQSAANGAAINEIKQSEEKSRGQI